MASCARSGETLMLRMLAAHPEIHVPFDLQAENGPEERAAQTFLMQCTETELARDHPALGGRVPPEARLLLVKQGVWEHPAPFHGFVLARNPVAVIASLLDYDARRPPTDTLFPEVVTGLGGRAKRLLRRLRPRQQMTRHEDPGWERLLRWQDAIDPGLTPFLNEMPYTDALCAFYTRRMAPLVGLGLPVVCYERLVTEPEREMADLLDHLGLDMVPEVLGSHTRYARGSVGHGKIDLSRPVSTASLDAWRGRIDRATFHRIAGLTYPAWSALGYRLSWEEIRPPPRP
ncbi:MAG: hypothetical protein AAF416_21715 [Pseudomonadota bacterium]